MQLTKLKLNNFRNYLENEINFHPFLNILVGDNAQGKTNILEAIYYLSTGKSHRTNKEQEMILWGEKDLNVKGWIDTKNGPLEISIIAKTGTRKLFKINGIDKKKIGHLLGNFNVVLFSPEDLYLIKGNPAARRKFLDEEISQVNPKYYYYLSQYQRIVFQRNELLKNLRSGKGDPDTLELWDQQLANIGSLIITKRIEVLKKLNPLARLMHRKITNGLENLEIKYVPSVEISSNLREEEIRDKIIKECALIKREEIARGLTLRGPHRDDLLFCINEQDVRAYGSQGQQRTTVLSLKLAEIEFMKSEAGEYPVLLLDDVMSELDENRRIYLLESIKDRIQTFVTTTNLHYFEEKVKKEGIIFKVIKGKVV